MLDVAEKHLRTIKNILAEYVGECEVRAFGSRVTGTARDHSDLDLAIVGKGRLTRRTKTLLREAFEISDLPFRVEIVDYAAVSDSFRAIIDAECEVLSQ